MGSAWDATFWDLGGVILAHDSLASGHRAFIDELAAEYPIDPETALEIWREELGTYFRERDKPAYRRARPGYQQAIDEIVGEYVPEEVWLPMYERATAKEIKPVPHMKETVTAIADAGLYLAVVSDIDTWEAERILSLFDVDRYFHHVTTSEEVGKTKPDEAMFRTALAKTDVRPERSLMIGDRYEHDMKGGTRAGLRTVAHGGSAAASVDSPAEGHEVTDEFVDYRITDLRQILDILDIDSPESSNFDRRS